MENKFKKAKTTSTVGGRICKLRLRAEMSQEQLAEKLYTSSCRVSRLENGRQTPTCEEVVKLCELFNATADYIIRGIDPAPANLDLTPEEKKLVVTLLEKLKDC